jgi:hypothetical protein
MASRNFRHRRRSGSGSRMRASASTSAWPCKSMVEHRLWQGNPEVRAYAEKSRQHPAGEALTARHLKAQGVALTPTRIVQLITAAALAGRLQGSTRVQPSSEKQLRPLVNLRPRPTTERLAQLWNEAVASADGPPTASQVRAIVQTHYPSTPTRSRLDRAMAAVKALDDRELRQALRSVQALSEISPRSRNTSARCRRESVFWGARRQRPSRSGASDASPSQTTFSDQRSMN